MEDDKENWVENVKLEEKPKKVPKETKKAKKAKKVKIVEEEPK